MTKLTRRQRLSQMAKFGLVAMAAAAMAGCSMSTHGSGPISTTVSKPSSTPPAHGHHGNCKVNPATAAVPSVKPYEVVPAGSRISVTLSGIPSGTVKPGAEPTEVDVTLCNDSAVAYPKIGVVLVIKRCSCANNPLGIARGTVESFDPSTNAWVKLPYPEMGTAMDYIGAHSNVQELPKGKVVTLRYRVALDASMTDGIGGVQAAVVVPKALAQIGRADLPFMVSQNPASVAAPSPRQTVLPFTGLTYPTSVATDTAGNVYVVDGRNNRVVRLSAGSNTQSVLPFTGLKIPTGVAVDNAGNVYVTDRQNNRVVELPAGSTSQTVLPFTGLDNPSLVAADSNGNVYVIDRQDRVVKLAVGPSTQTVLELAGIKPPRGLAVDGAGNVYVNDGINARVVKVAAGSGDQTELPLTGIDHAVGMAVDSGGNAYVVDIQNKRVLKLPARSATPIVLPFNVFNGPQDVAVDGAGNVYVLDSGGFGQVVKLAAG